MLAIFALLVGLVAFAAMSRRAKQRAAVRGLRSQFPPIARAKLAAFFPSAAALLSDRLLQALFDWILQEMFRRTRTQSFGRLMQWAIENGSQIEPLTSEIARAAVDRLPAPVLQKIDGESFGRDLAGGMIKNALDEAGTRIGPELNRKYV